MPLEAGDVVCIETGGGGGYGDPRGRALDAIQRDRRRAATSRRAAAVRDYGVRVAPDGTVTR